MSVKIQLRWASHQGTLVNTLQSLLKKDNLLDVTLAAEGQYVRAHKVMLCACSPYFEELLSISEDKHPIIMLQDVKYSQLQALLSYMYYGEVCVEHENLESLLRVGESLQIRGLFASSSVPASGTDELGDVKFPATEYQVQPQMAKRDGRKEISDADCFNSATKKVKCVPNVNGSGNCVIRLVRANWRDSSFHNGEETDGTKEKDFEDNQTVKTLAAKTDTNQATTCNIPHVFLRSPSDSKRRKEMQNNDCTDNIALENIGNRENLELSMESSHQNMVVPYFEDHYLSNDESLKDSHILPASPSMDDDDKDDEQDNGNGPEQIFKCKCGKQYTSNKSLWRHKKFACEGKQTFSCHLCGKIFSRSDNLRRHAVVAHCIQ